MIIFMALLAVALGWALGFGGAAMLSSANYGTRLSIGTQPPSMPIVVPPMAVLGVVFAGAGAWSLNDLIGLWTIPVLVAVVCAPLVVLVRHNRRIDAA